MGWLLNKLGFEREKQVADPLDLSKLQQQLAPHFFKLNPWMGVPKKPLTLLHKDPSPLHAASRKSSAASLSPDDEIRGLDDLYTSPLIPPLWEELSRMAQGAFTKRSPHLTAQAALLKAETCGDQIDIPNQRVLQAESLDQTASHLPSIDAVTLPYFPLSEYSSFSWIEDQEDESSCDSELTPQLESVRESSKAKSASDSVFTDSSSLLKLASIQQVIYESSASTEPPLPKTQFDSSIRQRVKWPGKVSVQGKSSKVRNDGGIYYSAADECQIADYQMQNHRILARSIQHLVDGYFEQSAKEESV